MLAEIKVYSAGRYKRLSLSSAKTNRTSLRAVALMPDLLPKPLRSSGNAVINLMGAVGGMYSLILIQFLVKEEKNPSCLMVAMVAAIISYIPISVVSSKIGRKKSILQGLTMMLISYSAVFFYHTYNVTANFFFALIGVGWAAVGVNSLPMVVEMSKGSDIGKYTGLYYTFSMTAQIVTPILSGLLLEYISYSTLFPYAIFFTVCAIITMTQVRHGDARPAVKKSVLENFEVED